MGGRNNQKPLKNPKQNTVQNISKPADLLLPLILPDGIAYVLSAAFLVVVSKGVGFS